MKQVQYMQILRDSQEIQLRDKLTLLSSKAHQYVVQQFKQLESQYKQQLLIIIEQYQQCKLMCQQLQLKNEQYSKLLLEQEFKSVQNKNYVSLEIVNQLLTQKIKSLLIQLKNNNIISEFEYLSQKNILQQHILDVYINSNNQDNQHLIQSSNQNLLPNQIIPTSQQQESQNFMFDHNDNYLNINHENQLNINHDYETKNHIGTQTKFLKKKEKSVKQNKAQNQIIQSPSPDLDRELLECKKSIQELQKSKIDLQTNNEFLKSQNQNLLSKLSQKLTNYKKCNHFVMKNTNTPQIIKKFLKFDDILFKNVTPFSMAQSFDLRKGNISSRQFFTRPKTSAPNSTRNRCNSTQQPSSVGFHIL